MKIMAINAGSSSLKFSLYNKEENKILVSGIFERIGNDNSSYTMNFDNKTVTKKLEILNHMQAVAVLLAKICEFDIIDNYLDIDIVGNRIAHGGEKYKESVIITDEVIEDIDLYSSFAPLHNPSALKTIKAIKKVLPNAVLTATFDTAFHGSIPKVNYLYPVPYDWYLKHGVRKYGFHGISYKYITEEMKKDLDKKSINLIICHLGSGASVCCVKSNKSIDTSMGFSPISGLMMGSRSGNIDPLIIPYVSNIENRSVSSICDDLGNKSGFYGMLNGISDLRDIWQDADKNDENSLISLEMFHQRIVDFIAKYYNRLEGRVDGLVFTAGIGENSYQSRNEIIKRLKALGFSIDKRKNKTIDDGLISDNKSNIKIYIKPTNEEKVIIEDSIKLYEENKLNKNKVLTR